MSRIQIQSSLQYAKRSIRSPASQCYFERAVRRSQRSDFATQSTHSNESSLPRVIRPSMWRSMVPNFLRRNSETSPSFGRREWNPATFFIVIFMLIGSQAIQMIALRNESSAYSRRADAKIALLKEVIERVQKGEDVDVEGLLGTGDAKKEKEWEEVLREIQDEDYQWQKRAEAAKRKALKSQPNTSESPSNDPAFISSELQTSETTQPKQSPSSKGQNSGYF